MHGEFTQKKNNKSDEFMSVAVTRSLQGLAAVGVVFHHLSQQMTAYGSVNKGPITVLSSMGILFTAMFFFISGYGLMVSLDNKKDYLRGFLPHRFITVLTPFWLVNTIYVIYRITIDRQVMDAKTLVSYILGLKLINSNGWFIIEILILYIAFYICFKAIKNKNLGILVMCVFTGAMILYAKSRGYDNGLSTFNSYEQYVRLTTPNTSWFKGEWWFNSTILFPIGLIAGRNRGRLEAFLKKYYWPLLSLSIVLFLITFGIEEHIRKVYGYHIDSFVIRGGMSASTRTLISQMIVCIVWTFMVVLISMKVSLRGKILALIGSFSLELLLIHHLIMDIIGSLTVRGYGVRFILVTIASCLAALILSRLDKVIIKTIEGIYSKLVKTKAKEDVKITLERAIINKRRKANITRALILVGLLAVAFVVYWISSGHALSKKDQLKQELEALRAAKVGDQVMWGTFDTDMNPLKERLSWIVLEIDGNRYTLISSYGIDSAPYYDAYQEIGWEDSSIRERLASREYVEAFSSYEKEYMLLDELGDLITIPTISQASMLTKEQRVLASTPIALSGGANSNVMSKVNYWDYNADKASWWWLRMDEGVLSLMAPIVTVDGDIVEDVRYVNKPSGAIRPLITVELH